MEIAAVPTGPVDLPTAVGRLAAGEAPVPVWRNTLGGLTFRLGAGDDIRFVKWMPPAAPSFEDEVERLNSARMWHIPLPDRFSPAEGVHVGRMSPNRASRARGVTGREFSDEAIRIERRYGFPVTDAASTWCHLAGVLSHDDLVAAGDHLVLVPRKAQPGEVRPYATIEELTIRAGAYSGRHARALRRALVDVRQGAESRPETILRLVMARAGLPEPELNVDIFSAAGLFLGRGDTLFRRFRVIAEYDGEQHRTDSVQYNKNMLRIEGFIRDKWMPIRVRKGQLFGDPAAAVARIEGALRDAGWRP